MKLIAIVVLLTSCATAPAPVVVEDKTEQQPVMIASEVKNPNFMLVVTESVPNPDDDSVTMTKVFVDGNEVGKTVAGRRSQKKVLKLELSNGNKLIKLEHWLLPAVGEWEPLLAALQPRERFVRVEDGSIIRLDLRFADGQVANVLNVSREYPESQR